MGMKRCVICGTAAYCGPMDVIFGLKHSKGWTLKMICAKCMGNRQEFMKEYHKLESKLVGLVRRTRRDWMKEEGVEYLGNGVYKLTNLKITEIVPPKKGLDMERTVAEDRGGEQQVAECGRGC